MTRYSFAFFLMSLGFISTATLAAPTVAAQISTAPVQLAQANPDQPKIMMSYWWYNEDSVQAGKSEMIYPVPGSLNRAGQVVQNPDLTAKLNYLNVFAYAFFQVSNKGVVHFQDSDVDLGPGDAAFCAQNKNICTDPANGYAPKLGSFDAFTQLQNKKGDLRKVISIGGGGDVTSFNNAIHNIPAFVDSVATIVNAYHLDGVDLDFEVANTFTKTQGREYTQLIAALRAKLGPKAFISMATAYDTDTLHSLGVKNWQTINANVSVISDMCYDFHTPYSSLHYTGEMSNLYPNPQEPQLKGFYHASCDASVKYLTYLGVPSQKIVLGVPFYAFSYGDVSSKNHGLFQPFNPHARPSMGGTKPGIVKYETVVDMLHEGFKSYATYYNGHVSGTWAYNKKTKQVLVYDSPALMKEKGDYIAQKNLGGAMIWALNFDVAPKSHKSLLRTLASNVNCTGCEDQELLAQGHLPNSVVFKAKPAYVGLQFGQMIAKADTYLTVRQVQNSKPSLAVVSYPLLNLNLAKVV